MMFVRSPAFDEDKFRFLQVNPRYVPQLQTVLQWPQSAGIVGGRPSSSLYFVGCQEGHVIYLDPHEVQEVLLHQNAPPTPPCSHLCHCSGRIFQSVYSLHEMEGKHGARNAAF